jgi:diguanylate cyclase (GGDEF)-like protein
MEEQLRHNALYDGLTGLPNRTLFLELLQRSIDRARRRSGYSFAVLFLDLNRFKVVNDSLGHTTGDKLLIELARRFKSCLRPQDTVARLGGDEFTILLEGITDLNDATRIADRVHRALAYPFNLEGHEVYTSTSIGIAWSEINYDKPEDVLRDADTAMYSAKASGSSYAAFDRQMHARVVERLQLETDLRLALERQEFQLHYQPIMSLDTGKINGFEALIRWQHPNRGLISPGLFIPVAEENGVILPIGEWTLQEACRQMRQWERQFPERGQLTVNVNLSLKQFMQPNLVRQIEHILAETGVSPNRLNLEITESMVAENAESIVSMLLQLKTLEVGLHIDDFGTGYSSLSHLHRFPIDALKIDRSFVSNMSADEESLEIVKTIMALAQNLGMAVTAEGVETADQLALLKGLGCKLSQGYYFSRPVDAQKATALILSEKDSY